MRKRKELASEEKVSLVEEYLAGRLRMREAAREARLGHSTMENWISRYRSEGASGLRENGNQAKCQYSWGVKRRVVGNICRARAVLCPLRKSINCARKIGYWTG